MKKLFTSESVTEGHPDKLCDRISDAIVDEILKLDPNARCAIECCAASDRLMLMGEVSANAQVDYEGVARRTIKEIGYDTGTFAYDKCGVTVSIHRQSPDIAMGVDSSMENKAGGAPEDLLGAGDQGMMFGYACRETEELMPLPISLAHKLALRLTEAQKSGTLPFLRPDGKTQVTVEYDGKKPVRVDTVVVSAQHDESITQEFLKKEIMKNVICVIPENLLDEHTKYLINPTGRFLIGGPEGDSGLTGRKIIVDTYGGRCAHGGGAFSGKDPTKVDRSAAYMARYAAKNIVAAGLADKCEIELAYAIGVPEPVSVYVETFGTGKASEERLSEAVRHIFELRPAQLINALDLRRPIYRQTAAYGHFGRDDLDLPWERTDRVEALKDFLK
ncbi:MAG TPA: methionine adenosyltransferase [Clostridiales bacterium]|nr:methionine adenosyltransferase [Clostridiales bacterium]